MEAQCLYIHFTMRGFFQHGGVSISVSFVAGGLINNDNPVEWTLSPFQFYGNRSIGSAALDLTSWNDIQPGRYVIRTPSPGEVLETFLM